jgi:hypothetical protein
LCLQLKGKRQLLNVTLSKADQDSMMRLLVFTVLFPPLVLFVYMAADPVIRGEVISGDLPGIGFLTWLMGFAYVLAVIPAWLTAGADWALSRNPLYLRLVATMPVAAILSELVATYLGQPHLDLTTALMGAIPAAVCSWLSDKSMALAKVQLK